MKKVISILLVIAVLSCFMVTVVSATNGAGTATVKVSSAQITKGQNATVSVSIADVPSYRSYAMAVKYDASKLEVVSVNGNVVSNTNNAGVIYVSFANQSNLNAGNLFSVTFKTNLNCGDSTKVSAEVEELWVGDENGKGVMMASKTQSGTVSIAHKAETVKGYAATCTKTGLTDGSKCSVCGEVLKAQEVIPMKAHSYKAVVTAPTCTEDGYTTYTCSACGDSYVGDKTAAKGHTIVVKEAVAPTCTETGLTEGKSCSVCGYVEVEQKVVPALGHTEVVDAAVAATCTSKGLTEGKHCSVCGTVLVAQVETEMAPHDFSEEYKYDDKDHWHVCVKCGALSDKEGHEHNIKVDEYKDKLFCICGHSIDIKGDDQVPETGDITGYVIFAGMALVAMVGAVAYTFKRKFAK